MSVIPVTIHAMPLLMRRGTDSMLLTIALITADPSVAGTLSLRSRWQWPHSARR